MIGLIGPAWMFLLLKLLELLLIRRVDVFRGRLGAAKVNLDGSRRGTNAGVGENCVVVCRVLK